MGWPDMETGIGTGYSFDDLPDALENGGAKEISVTGLSGLLADDQHVLDAEVLAVAAALVHASRHQNSGADEISVTGLSGLLADDQHFLKSELAEIVCHDNTVVCNNNEVVYNEV